MDKFSHQVSKYLGIPMLGLWVNLFIIIGTLKTVSRVFTHFHSHQQCMRVPLS